MSCEDDGKIPVELTPGMEDGVLPGQMVLEEVNV